MTRQNSHTAHDAWLALQNQFISNRETRALHIDATFRNFIQGDLNMNDYCRKMKGFTDSLNDLDAHVSDRVLVLNILRGLNKQYEHLCAIFTHTMPLPSFQKVCDDLCLKEIQQGTMSTQSTAAAPTAFYPASNPSAPPPAPDGQACPPRQHQQQQFRPPQQPQQQSGPRAALWWQQWLQRRQQQLQWRQQQ
jgi:hypothetical protein